MLLKRPLEEAEEAYNPLVIELQTFCYVDFIDTSVIEEAQKQLGRRLRFSNQRSARLNPKRDFD
jgi:hypothetical protein